MPEKEFEIYLSLLSKLLRLSPAQKAAISDELRDHMEQRLADLIQGGMSRDEAIKTAMDEFGDVTGLALDLTRVSKSPIKKVVVRGTVAASIAAVAIVCWVSFFAPDHRAVAPVAVHAQQAPSSGDQADKVEPARPRPDSAFLSDEELFPDFLSKTIEVNFSDNPLHEVCSYLSDITGVPVMLNRLSLTDAGISTDQQITLKLNGLTFEEVLNHLTKGLGLGWEVEPGGIVRILQNGDPWNDRLLIRQYDLRKLMKLGHSPQSLMAIMQLAADWRQDMDGQGTAALIGDSVVIRQNYHAHRRIAAILAAIEQQQPITVIETCTGRDHLLEAMKKPGDVSFSDAPLEDVISFLSDTHGVQILLDRNALADEGISTDAQLTLTLHNRPLRTLLKNLLHEMGLTYIIRDGAITVTTKAKADETMTYILYNVRDLGVSEQLMVQLSEAIVSTTTGKWMNVDQEGGTFELTDGGCLLVKQTDQVQSEIQAMLGRVRMSRQDGAAEPAKPAPRPKLVTKGYQMPSDVAADLNKSLVSLVAPESWKEAGGETPVIHMVAAIPQRDEIDGVVSGGPNEVQVINTPTSTDKKGPVAATVKSIVVRPRSMLIIRQTPQVHREIRKFLHSIGVFTVPTEISHPDEGQLGGAKGGLGGAFF